MQLATAPPPQVHPATAPPPQVHSATAPQVLLLKQVVESRLVLLRQA